jgi:rubrerythrin
MRLRIERLVLQPTTREVTFRPGLNIVAGPITTGKTTLLRLCRILLASPVEALPPEVREHVAALSGGILIGASRYDVVRELVSTDTAKVEIANEDVALRLPALRRDATAPTTYGRWLLSELALPELEVPSAPTRPAESTMTPVSINDYMLYCRLGQDEIDSSVFGHNNPFKDIKRRYVFQILYGLYDVETARLQEELRTTELQLKTIEAEAAAFESFLTDTAWENRAALEADLTAHRARLAALHADAQAMAEQAGRSPEAQELRLRVQDQDRQLSELRESLRREQRSAEQLTELAAQLESQSARLTRSIVAGSRLLDIDFQVCPRCGTAVASDRASEEDCYLCLQTPTAQATRHDLIAEQERIDGQLVETRQLLDAHARRQVELEESVASGQTLRQETAAALDAAMSEFVADEAERISERAAVRARLESETQRFEDYLAFYAKLDEARTSRATLERRRDELVTALETSAEKRQSAEERIRVLEKWFAHYIEAFDTPRFEGSPRAAINRDNFMPIVNGRTFGQLSSGGLRTLTNLAHALAHHRAAHEQGLGLPGFLLIDAIQKNVGRDEYDTQRVEAVFRELVTLGAELGEDLQVIVAANDVPAFAEGHVVLRLSEEDRLVPIGN